MYKENIQPFEIQEIHKKMFSDVELGTLRTMLINYYHQLRIIVPITELYEGSNFISIYPNV